MIAFHVAAALFALLVLVRNGRRALVLTDRAAPPEARTGALVPLIACAAAAVLVVAVKGLVRALMLSHGGTP